MVGRRGGGRGVKSKHLTLANRFWFAEAMAQPLRIEFEDAIYHLCARGNARQLVFRDEPDCAHFLKLLSESAQRFNAALASGSAVNGSSFVVAASSAFCFFFLRPHANLPDPAPRSVKQKTEWPL